MDTYQTELLTSEALQTCGQKICADSRNATSSLGLVAGAMPYLLPDGRLISRSGQEAAHVNHSVAPERGEQQKMSGIFGPCSPSSSASASLQQSLANRLRARLAGSGSPEYSLTWKEWDIRGQEPICALRASGHRTSANGCGGWPTPDAQAMNVGCNLEKHLERMERLKQKHNNGNGAGLSLGVVSQMAGWPTPMVNDTLGSTHCYGKKTTDGSPRPIFLKLPGAALLSGWPTPNHNTTGAGNQGRDGGLNLQTAATLAGWATPTTRDHKDGSAKSCENVPLNKLLGREVHLSGATPSSSPAGTEKPAALNPQFSLWLMGYPVAWASCGARAMQSSRKSRRSSSKPL
jgi:hypothetical protein